MIKKKAIHAMIIGTCIFANSIAGVYADTTAPDTPVSIQIEQVKYSDALTQKQSEIDRYVFEEHTKDFADKGITVTNTGIMGNFVEVGIAPFNEENAKYIYKIFGEESVKVVEGIQATTLQYGSEIYETSIVVDADTEANDVRVQLKAPVEEKTSAVAVFFNSIVEWFKSIF